MNWGLLAAGTAAASVPIIIHLLNRLRFKRIQWAAMEFLLAAHRKNARRVRIEQLLLLLLRTLIVLLLAAALARPVLEGLLAGLGRSSVHRIVVIDDSFSMGAEYGVSVGGETAMKEARKTALWLMERFDDRDAVSLVMAGSMQHGKHTRLTSSFDHEQVVADIERLRPSDAATDMVGALKEVKALIAESQSPQHVVYVLTDNTDQAWRDETAKDLRALAASIAESADLVVADLSRSQQSNLAIGTLYPERAVVTRGILSQFRVEVTNFGDAPVERATISMSVDGIEARPLTIRRIGPDETELRTWSHTFETPGEHTVVASLKESPADAVRVDSRRHLAVNVKTAINCLLVDGEPAGPRDDGETFYLKPALDPRTFDQQRETVFLVERVRDTELSAAMLEGLDVVFLANVAALQPSQADALRRFVSDGGSLVVTLGDQVQATQYNQDLYDEGQGLMPAFIAPPLGSTEGGPEADPVAFDIRRLDHPALAAFAEAPGGAGLDMVHIYKYYALKLPVESADSRAILYFSDGNPAMVEKLFGRGRVVMFATTADAEWTDLPRLPPYLQLIHELMDYVTPDVLWRYNRIVGAETVIPVSAGLRGEQITLTRPDGSTEADLQPEAQEGRYVLKVDQLDRAGVYTLEGRQFGRRSLAVNVDTRESDLAHIEPQDLTERLGGAPVLMADGQGGLAAVMETQKTAGGWARNLLAVMIVALLLETFLAWFFNRNA